MNSSHYKGDAFQATIQLLVVTTREIYMSSRFACQQRVLKTFPGPVYLRCEDGVV